MQRSNRGDRRVRALSNAMSAGSSIPRGSLARAAARPAKHVTNATRIFNRCVVQWYFQKLKREVNVPGALTE